jgi:SAM-dependent methyltransferase
MKRRFGIEHLLRCPTCDEGPARELRGEQEGFRCGTCGALYPIVNGIPRFVGSENYAANFGVQWNLFRTTQLDSASGVPISRNRFCAQTGWAEEDLRGRLVLDAGCGAGRFAEIAVGMGARVVAVDFSVAVEACRQNLPADRCDVLQADIFRLPFAAGTFDFVYSFGVLQHTPDPRAAFLSLTRMVKPGGRVAIDVYPRTRLTWLWPKYWIRPVTRRFHPDAILALSQRLVRWLWPISVRLGRLRLLNGKLRYAIPVANYDGLLPLNDDQLRQWAVLDTFDMLAPRYDRPQTLHAVTQWFHDAGLRDVEVFRAGQLIGRGVRPGSSDSRGSIRPVSEPVL